MPRNRGLPNVTKTIFKPTTMSYTHRRTYENTFYSLWMLCTPQNVLIKCLKWAVNRVLQNFLVTVLVIKCLRITKADVLGQSLYSPATGSYIETDKYIVQPQILIFQDDSYRKPNKMPQCIRIFLFHIYMKLTMFRATHRPSSEPKTALAASGFACLEGCWTCSCWTLSGRVCSSRK